MHFRGTQTFSPHRPERRKREQGRLPSGGDMSASPFWQELQAEQQQSVHGCRGHSLHRHYQEVELHDPGPAGLRYLISA
jgi:hypothetical protein